LPTLDPDIAAEAVGKTIPFVFGRVERCPLVPFRSGRRGYLRQALQPNDPTAALEDVSDFPEAGTVQIGDELITYNAIDRISETLGRTDSPLVRLAPAYHRAGAAADWAPPSGFEYLVADHRCRAVGPIYASERMIDPSRYIATTAQLGRRTVQRVVFPALPSEVSYGSILQVRRIDGRQDENLWGAGSGNAAESPLAAVDGAGQTTAAVLAAGGSPLCIEYLGDLSAGTTIYGTMRGCRLLAEFSASERWSVTNEITVEVGRGSQVAGFVLNRPPLDESVATLPAHSHADTIRDEIGDTRELFEIAEQVLVVDFDLAEASAGWAEPERAIDGNAATWTQNTPAGGPRQIASLRLRLLRQRLAAAGAVSLETIEFQVRLASAEATTVLAALDANVAGKYVNSWTVEVGAIPATFTCTIGVSGLSPEDLTNGATEFAVRSVDGRNLCLHGAWLTLKYRPQIVGRVRPLSQWRSGSVEASAPLPVALPTRAYGQEFDLTDFVLSNGGWRFFAPLSGERPFVRITFNSTSDPAAVHVSEIAFEVTYAPRAGVEVYDRLDATVEGVERSGALLENAADIIEWLVTDEAGLGWGEATIDQTSFSEARTYLQSCGWRLSRRVGAPLPIVSLLEQVAEESGCRIYWEAGSFRLKPLPTVLLSSKSVATLDSSLILSSPLVKRASTARAANVVRLRYGAGYTIGGSEKRTRGVGWLEATDAGAIAAGMPRTEIELSAHWLASAPAELAERLASLWLGQVAQPPRLVEVQLPLSQSHIERGDVVLVHHPSSRLDNAVGEIVAVEYVDGRHVRATVAVQIAAMYCWYGSASVFIVHTRGNAQKTFVIEGKRVAALDRTGQLMLRSDVVEQGLSTRAMSEAIEYDPVLRRLFFGVGSASTGFTAVFALDAQGRLLLRGAARENADLSSLTIDACHRAEPTRFLFSCDKAEVVFAYDAAADRLDLTGTIVENSPV
ncbi:hypothetical protein FJY63_05475, partial [Candidatus Sumerlaeota bacterium]|nr:hypothetical protein [Candidatus Sumerlaeota bacterium]